MDSNSNSSARNGAGKEHGQEKPTQGAEEKHKFPNIDQADFKVQVFWDVEVCEKFLAEGTWPKPGTVILGFDAEYTAEHDVAMIQMSDEDTVVIVKLAYVNPKDHSDKKILPVPPGIRKILESGAYIKAGVAVYSDAQSLLTQYSDLVMDGLLDISALALAAGITTTLESLGNLSQDLLGIPKGKSTGCWAYRYMLTPEQAKYAAYDAWVGLRVAQELYKTLREEENEGVREWCLRAIKMAEPHTEEHVRGKNNSDVVYVDGAACNGLRKGDSAPQRVKDRYAEKKKLMSLNGVMKGRLNDFKRKKDKYKSDERDIDEALNALKRSSSSSSSSSEPSKKKQRNELSSYVDEDDGMQMNFF